MVTIAANRGQIASAQGPKTIADYGYNEAPHSDPDWDPFAKKAGLAE
jgi:hypothetical protein